MSCGQLLDRLDAAGNTIIAARTGFDLSPALALLKKVFGYHSFRGHQEQVIEHLLNGGDTLLLAPTGGGKSLCYQLPALLRPGVGIVVSPLIALMQDQVRGLRELGVSAAFWNSTLSGREMQDVERGLRAGRFDLLYVAPERLVMPQFVELLKEVKLALFAIDEAHCVSQWGHDFRPEYLQLSLLHQQFPAVPRIALTATADEVTRQEILNRLGLTNARVFISSFDRPNIQYRVGLKNRPKEQLLDFLRVQEAGSAGIVYCLSRAKTEETAQFLVDHGYRALAYHAGLTANERQCNQERFVGEEGLIMAATIAFGMGIDKPDVRWVAHLDLPKSVEAYYQETGRAGRDGLPSTAWMVYSLADIIARRTMIAGSEADDRFKQIEQRRLSALLGYCESTVCRRQVLLRYFGEQASGSCGNCDLCLEPPQLFDGTMAAQKALSAVYRTGQRFGVKYLVDLLCGKSDERMERMGHTQLPTFGIGKELSEREWSSVYRQLIAAGLLSVDLGGYGSLMLTAESKDVLSGRRPVQIRRDPAAAKKKRRRVKSSAAAEVLSAEHADLFEILRRHRTAIARAANLPPYIIFHDATLREIAQIQPRTLQEMLQISGVGEGKLERYGASFLEVVLSYCSGRTEERG